MDFSIEKGQQKHIGEVVELIKELAEFENMTKSFVATKEDFEKAFADNHFNLLVATVCEKVVGYAIYFYNFSTFEGKRGIFVEDAYVKQAFRGNGIGREIFKTLSKECLENGYPRLEWMCLDWNEKSIAFYYSMSAQQKSEWRLFRLEKGDMGK